MFFELVVYGYLWCFLDYAKQFLQPLGPAGNPFVLKWELWYSWSLLSLTSLSRKHMVRKWIIVSQTSSVFMCDRTTSFLLSLFTKPWSRHGLNLLWDTISFAQRLAEPFSFKLNGSCYGVPGGKAGHCGKRKGNPCSLCPQCEEKWDAIHSKHVIQNITAGLIPWNKANAKLWVDLLPRELGPECSVALQLIAIP